MSLWRAPARRLLELPAPRARAIATREWVAMADGTRLATCVVRPRGGAEARGTLLVRGTEVVHAPRSVLPWLAGELAGQGLTVVLQECRGLHASEGTLTPFTHEASDGADTLAWLTREPWYAPPLALAGFGYAGYAAYAALARSPVPVASLVVGHAARDPHAWLHAGGALRLHAAFSLAFGLASGERDAPAGFDLERALRHRPLREADRVGARRLDWLREWLDHPKCDAFWDALTAPLPAQVPRALLLTRANDASRDAMRADHAALAAAAGADADVVLEIDAPLEEGRARPIWQLVRTLRSALAFLLSEPGPRRARLRAFDAGASRWRELDPATQAGVAPLRLFLRHGGRITEAEPDAGEAAGRYVYDPADATPAAGDERGDVLRYTSEPFATPLELAGSVRAELCVASDAPATDFCVAVSAVDAAGGSTPMASGIARMAWGGADAAQARRVDVDCGFTCFTLAAGGRLRVEIASACHPRFDRACNTGEEPARAAHDAGAPARQALLHDALRPSCVVFHSRSPARE